MSKDKNQLALLEQILDSKIEALPTANFTNTTKI